MLSNPNLDLVSRFVRLPLAQQKLFYQRVQAKGMSFARLPIPQTRQEMDNLPLSYAQERQWFLWQLEPESSAYHIPTALRLRGRLDIASCSAASRRSSSGTKACARGSRGWVMNGCRSSPPTSRWRSKSKCNGDSTNSDCWSGSRRRSHDPSISNRDRYCG